MCKYLYYIYIYTHTHYITIIAYVYPIISGFAVPCPRYDHNGSGKVRVERIPDLILNLGRDLQPGLQVRDGADLSDQL